MKIAFYDGYFPRGVIQSKYGDCQGVERPSCHLLAAALHQRVGEPPRLPKVGCFSALGGITLKSKG
jgi:hypothetical protein